MIALDVGPKTAPAQKAKFINAFKQGAQSLAQAGWLTAAQATTLDNLAGAL